MKPIRLVAIVFIYIGVSAAWGILGTSVALRTEGSLSDLRDEVSALWGTPLEQPAPTLVVEETVTFRDDKGKQQSRTVSHQLVPESSDIEVSLHSDARRKGLLWYRTYGVEFEGSYTVKHDYTRSPVLTAKFHFPSAQAIYDDFHFSVNGREAAPGADLEEGVSQSLPVKPGQPAKIRIHYESRGLDSWTYVFDEGVSQVKNFKMVVNTDFRRLNFPTNSLSPTHKEVTESGWRLTWDFASLISGLQVGVETPEEPNPGPIIYRITFFAPVGLLFFLSVVVIIGLMRRQNLHPMHYFFVGGGFFAFHLLMAYLGDHVEVRLTFLICALVSVALVVSYLVRAIGWNFAIRVAAPAQLLFLVLFSYAFFFKGYTGLAITLASILTLGIMMHVTAKVDWETRFQTRAAERKPPTPPPAPPPAQGS